MLFSSERPHQPSRGFQEAEAQIFQPFPAEAVPMKEGLWAVQGLLTQRGGCLVSLSHSYRASSEVLLRISDGRFVDVHLVHHHRLLLTLLELTLRTFFVRFLPPEICPNKEGEECA